MRLEDIINSFMVQLNLLKECGEPAEAKKTEDLIKVLTDFNQKLGTKLSDVKPEKTIGKVPKEIDVYVDGSFDKEAGFCGSGVVFVENDEEIDCYSFASVDEYNQWNIQGECEACLNAIKTAGLNEIEILHIYYDYQGVESWATGAWKAKNPYTQGYVKRFNEMISEYSINVIFHKVKGHSGNRWNDRADKLARQCLGK